MPELIKRLSFVEACFERFPEQSAAVDEKVRKLSQAKNLKNGVFSSVFADEELQKKAVKWLRKKYPQKEDYKFVNEEAGENEQT